MSRDKHEAGRELDALIAEKVMGTVPCDNWRQWHAARSEFVMNEPRCTHICTPRALWPLQYSTNISCAWALVERFKGPLVGDKHGWSWAIELEYIEDGPERAGWVATIAGVESDFSETAPLAICRAALKAVAA